MICRIHFGGFLATAELLSCSDGQSIVLFCSNNNKRKMASKLKLKKFLAKGGFGQVYEVSNWLCAIKLWYYDCMCVFFIEICKKLAETQIELAVIYITVICDTIVMGCFFLLKHANCT